MKRSLLWIACLLCLLTACGGEKEEPAETDWTPAQMARAVWDAQPALEGDTITYDDEDFAPYLQDTLASTPRTWPTARSATPAASTPRRSSSSAWRRRRTYGAH